MCVYVQPVKEEIEVESEKRGGEEREAESEKREGGEEKSAVVSPLKPGKKMKMVVCHVTLLDGNQFQCEVEVCTCV